MSLPWVIALALYAEVSYGEVLRCLVEGLRWLSWPLGAVAVTGKSGISQARGRLGAAPVKRLYRQVVTPIARPETKGAWYGRRRLVSLDGSTLDVADVAANAAAFGRPGASRGRRGYPQLRFVCLVENGTHVLFGAELGAYASGEQTLAGAEPLYRLITTMTDPASAPARELAALYHERWEIENAFDELKTHRRGRRLVLRSKTPTLVEQEFYGVLLAHHAIRGLMHEAALKADVDPDEISFVHAVRVVRRKIPLYPAIPPSAAGRLP